MALTVTETRKDNANSIIYNPKFLYVTPYVDGKPGTKTWQCMDIIRDSTTITQEDNTENPIENELSSTPIINNIQAGNYTFTTEIGDLQAELLKDLLGFTIGTDKNAYAPDGYVEKFARIDMVFQNGSKFTAVVLPKLQLSPTITLDSMSTSIGRIALSGSAQAVKFKYGSDTATLTPLAMIYNYTFPPEDMSLNGTGGA